MAVNDLDFVQSLYEADKLGLFVDVSCTLFRVRSLVLIIAADQVDVLGSGDHVRERDELDKCRTLEWENCMVEKELSMLHIKAKLVNYLRDNVDQYGSPSNLAAQIAELKTSLAKGEKHWKRL